MTAEPTIVHDLPFDDYLARPGLARARGVEADSP